MPSVAPRLLGPPTCVWPAQAELGEGTCWSVREQALYWVDILGQQLHGFWPADGSRRSWAFDETISAVAERARGPGLIVSLRRRLAFFDPASRQTQGPQVLQVLAEPEPEAERAGNRFNDGKCDLRGRFWAGTMDFDCKAPTGALYMLEAAPHPQQPWRCRRAFDAGFVVTNGPTWIDDGRTMLFNDTVRGRVCALAFDADTARLGAPRLWLQFGPGDGKPDGMTTDADGRVWLAHWGAGVVTCHDPVDARELLRVALPVSNITNLAFGGADLRTLFVTTARTGLDDAARAAQPLAGGLFAIATDGQGVPAHLFAG
jgi:sugar lactone lactonase YvrE